MLTFSNKLCADIDLWNGIQTNRHKQFKQYYKQTKNWWDQHKKSRYGELLCCIFKFVQHSCNKSGCTKNCIYPFMLNLLNKTVKFPQ